LPPNLIAKVEDIWESKKEMGIVKSEQAKGLTLEMVMMEYGAAKFNLFLFKFCVPSITLS
jgi:hypothetical protein